MRGADAPLGDGSFAPRNRTGAAVATGVSNLGSRMHLFVPVAHWPRMLFWTLLSVILLSPMVERQSPWIAVGLGMSLLVVWHALLASRTVPWIPGLFAGIACLQWILAPMASYWIEGAGVQYGMLLPPADYFGFIVPATAALIAGAYLPLRRLGQQRVATTPATVVGERRLRATCDAMVVVGLLVRIVVVGAAPGGLRYAFLLVSHLAFVGAFALAIARQPGWQWRVLATLAVTTVYSSEAGLFHDLVLWVSYLTLILAYAYRLRIRTLALIGASALFAIFVLNGIKEGYRSTLASANLTLTERTVLFADTFSDAMARPGDVFLPANLAANVSRLNQGWIIDRVLIHVPAMEPYARGETVVTALRAALLPRVIDPNKYVAGGERHFERFTGYKLAQGTSMNLSVAGEMYANFGRTGAWIGLFVYGLAFSYLYRVFVHLSRRSNLWWAWAPFVMLWTVQAETSIGESLNQATKSAIVMAGVIAVVPTWAMLRRARVRRLVAAPPAALSA